MTGDHFDSFISYLEIQKKYGAATLRSYTNDLKAYAKYLLEIETHYLDVHPKDMRMWVATMASQLARATINHRIAVVRRFYHYLEKENVIASNPMQTVSFVRKEKRVKAPLSVSEIKKVIEDSDEGSDFEALRNKLIFVLFYSMGLRATELITIKWKDVDLHRRTIRIRGKGNKERLGFILPFAVGIIKEYRAICTLKLIRNDSLLVTNDGKPLTYLYVYRLVKKRLKLYTTKEHTSPHVLRHSFATHLLDKGSDIHTIKELMGHSSASTTQNYLNASIEHLKSVYKKSHPKWKD